MNIFFLVQARKKKMIGLQRRSREEKERRRVEENIFYRIIKNTSDIFGG